MGLLDNLTHFMKEYNLNRTELANAIGIAPSTVNSWFNRGYDNISLQTLLKLSSFFGITIEQLVNGDTSQQIIFSSKDFTEKELKAIVNFSIFLKKNREL